MRLTRMTNSQTIYSSNLETSYEKHAVHIIVFGGSKFSLASKRANLETNSPNELLQKFN